MDTMDKDVVAGNGSLTWTRGELHALFDRVADPAGWKLPVNAVVTFDSDRDLLGTREAVIFFTGSVPTVSVETFRGGKVHYRVTADGYYAAVGA